MKAFLQKIFVAIPPEYKRDFLHEIGVENINRFITLGIAISILEVGAIFVLFNPAIAIHQAIVIGFNLVFLPFLWFRKKRISRQGISSQWITVVGFLAYLLYGCWLTLSIVRHGSGGSMLPPYLIAVAGLAAAIFLSPSLSLASYAAVNILFSFGVLAIGGTEYFIKANIVNSIVMNVLAWLISRILFRFRLDAFIAQRRIEQEQQKSDELLLNVLPVKVARELKQIGRTSPERFESVTVFFSDLVDFTAQSSRLTPDVLVSELNDLFTAFDEIAERHSCERIKTIGDGYMCVCGMPETNPAHARQVVMAAIDILHFLEERNRSHPIQWTVRIGIHSGSVVGGVVGVKKYIYDIFGDTVNTASRMENHSEPMKINISEETRRLVKDDFTLVERAPEIVKGKGMAKMFFVEGRRGLSR